jgi:ABC-type polysaccharide/polyol phosphate transport system ATPase subunit
MGVIGPNGAGKTTLLRVLAGVTGLTSGEVHTRGSVVSILELGVGMNPDFTGLENIQLSGMFMGMEQDEVAELTPAVLAFAGIGEAKSRPVKHYSSGMRARLGTAIALQLNPDLLLVDELLGVGDHEFRIRALARIREIQYKGAAVVFVSHNLRLVSELCDRTVRLDRGSVVDDGPTADVVHRYGGMGWATGSSTGLADIRLHDLELSTRWVPTGDSLSFTGLVEVAAPAPDVRLELSYRAVPQDRDVTVDNEYLEEHTFLIVTVEPEGGPLSEPGWYRFNARVDDNLLIGRVDIVVAAVDSVEGEILAEAWQSVTFGVPLTDDQLGPPLRMDWAQADRVDATSA